MSGICKPGFTLLEVVVVIGVIGILFGIAVTQLRFEPASPASSFVDDMYSCVKQTQLVALESHRQHRIVLGFEEQEVYVEQATDEYDAEGNPQFTPVEAQWDTRYAIPDGLEFTAVYVNGVDELAGGTTQRIWIYCYPSGMLQQTRIVVRETRSDRQYTIQINPVTADVDIL